MTTRPKSAHKITVHWSPTEPATETESVHLWLCDLDDRRWVVGELGLSATEHARAARLRTSELRRRFLARRVFLRRVLSGLLGLTAGEVDYRVGPFGKPELAYDIGSGLEHRPLPRFNLSHSEKILAVAVAFHREIGVDVELVKTDLDFLALGEGQLASEEIALLRSLPEEERPLAFYRSWTRREALAKATGCGIASSGLSGERTAVRGCDDPQSAAEYSFECSLGDSFAVGSLALCPPRKQPVRLGMATVGRGKTFRW